MYALSLLYYLFFPCHEFVSLSVATSKIIDFWSAHLKNVIVFFGLSITAGMVVHGLHWAIVGFLANKRATKKGQAVELSPPAS